MGCHIQSPQFPCGSGIPAVVAKSYYGEVGLAAISFRTTTLLSQLLKFLRGEDNCGKLTSEVIAVPYDHCGDEGQILLSDC